MGRLSQAVHFITRTDIGMAHNPKPNEYTHLYISVRVKRQRYLYQCRLKGKEPCL
jgi:hypothetical protein